MQSAKLSRPMHRGAAQCAHASHPARSACRGRVKHVPLRAVTDPSTAGLVNMEPAAESKCPVLNALKDAPRSEHKGIFTTLEMIFGDSLQYQASQVQGRPLVRGYGAEEVLMVNDMSMLRDVLTDDTVFAPETIANELFGPEAVLFLRGTRHSKVRSFLQPAFTPEALEVYAPKIQDLTEKYFAKLAALGAEGRAVKGYPNMKELTFEIICFVVSGIDLPEKEYRQLFEDNQSLFKGVAAMVLPWEFLKLPFMPVGEAWAARKRIMDLIDGKIAEAKACIARGEDVKGRGQLLEVVQRGLQSEEPLTDAELRDNMAVFVLAGFDTTSILITNLMQNIDKYPEHFQAVVEEQLAVMEKVGERLTPAAMKLMPKTDNFIRETLRIRMPAPTIARTAQQDTNLGEYRVNKGDVITVPLQYMGTTDPMWANQTGDLHPDVFNPNRYEAVKGPGSLFPFGYGKHSCVGQPLAMLEAKVALAVIARKYDIKVVKQPKQYVNLPVVHPVNGLPVLITEKGVRPSETWWM